MAEVSSYERQNTLLKQSHSVGGGQESINMREMQSKAALEADHSSLDLFVNGETLQVRRLSGVPSLYRAPEAKNLHSKLDTSVSYDSHSGWRHQVVVEKQWFVCIHHAF